MKKLISLEEHNKRARAVNETGGNGIACPNCGSELFDHKDSIILTTLNQYPTFCRACNYRGIRY